jgi:hypothetical protein
MLALHLTSLRRSLTRLLPLALLFVAASQAQVVMTSNLGESQLGYSGARDTNWISTSFTTDNSAAGWTLDSATLAFGNIFDASGNFAAWIYSDNASRPGTLLETLSGSGNPAVGNEVYTSAGLSLAPNTTYHLVTGVTSGSGSYGWSIASSTNETGPWSIGGAWASFSDGASWTGQSSSPYRFSITATATAIPEPSTYAALAGAGALGLAAWRRRRRTPAV